LRWRFKGTADDQEQDKIDKRNVRIIVMLSFFVPGQPRPVPKLEPARYRRTGFYPKDKDGSKRRWAESVRLYARRAMHNQKVGMIPVKVGVTCEYHFYFRRAPSNKDEQMVVIPDQGNCITALDNALKRLCFNDDNQINCHLVRTDYADDERPEGVMIAVYETMR